MLKKIGFLRRLFATKNKNEETYSESILGSKLKRRIFAKFWQENESDLLYLMEVLVYLQSQKNFKKDLREFKRGMGELIAFFRTAFEEDQLERGLDEEIENLSPRF